MLRRLAKAAVAHGLGRTGADEWIGGLSGAGKQPLVLGYHRVVEDADALALAGVPGMAVSTRTLERQLGFLRRRFRFVSLDELGARAEQGTAAGLAAVTFDDGYADFYENAFLLLQRMGIPAAVFVVTDLLEDGAGFLHDRVYAALRTAFTRWGPARIRGFLAERGLASPRLPAAPFPAVRALLSSLVQAELLQTCAALEGELGGLECAPRSLRWQEVLRMSRAGVTIASHTMTHALLAHEDAARVKSETAGSRAALEARLGVRVAHFCYPDGSFDAAAVNAVAAAGYRFAYTSCRHRDPSHPLLTLPRRVLWEGSTLGAHAGFSEDVLSCQVNGIFDFANACSGEHDGVAVRLAQPAQRPAVSGA